HLGVGKKRVARVMRKFSLKPARRAKSPRKPGDLGREVQPYPDLAAQICPIVPDHGRASDFTYIPYRNRHIYLATVIDLFTGEPVGSNIAFNHDPDSRCS